LPVEREAELLHVEGHAPFEALDAEDGHHALEVDRHADATVPDFFFHRTLDFPRVEIYITIRLWKRSTPPSPPWPTPPAARSSRGSRRARPRSWSSRSPSR